MGERDGDCADSGGDGSGGDYSSGDWEHDDEREQEMSSCGRGRVSREEAKRLEQVWLFIRHHPPPLPLMPRLLSWRVPPHHRPPTSPAHPTARTMAVQASHERDCSSSSSSSTNDTGGAVWDRRLVMLLVRRLKERHRNQHALELLQWHMARLSPHCAQHSPRQHERESQSGGADVEREVSEWEACELIDGLARCSRWRDARDAFLALPCYARSDKAYSGVLYQLARMGQHSRLQEELQWVHDTAGAPLGVCSFNARLVALSTLPSRLASAAAVMQRMDDVMDEMKAKVRRVVGGGCDSLTFSHTRFPVPVRLQGVAPSLFTFHILLRHCLHHPPHTPTSAPHRLDALLHAMHHHHRLLPSAQTHSILLRLFLHTGQLPRAEKYFHAMLEDGLAPSPAACAALWMAMGRAGKGGRGGEVEEMWRRVGGMGVKVTRPMHVARIAAHVAAGDIPMAEEAFSSLCACIRRLDRDACNALLKGYTRANMPDAALRLVDDMRRANIPCGTAMLSLLLSCLSRSQRLSHATALLSQLATAPETPVTVDSSVTTNPPNTPHHASLPGSVQHHNSTPASPHHALPSHHPSRHHGSQPPTPPVTIKRRALRGLMEALKAEGHVEGVRQAIHAGEAMWGRCEVAWYKMLIGAMLRRAEHSATSLIPLPPSAANCLDFSASPSLLCIPFSSLPPPFLLFPPSLLPPFSSLPLLFFHPSLLSPFSSFPILFFPPPLLIHPFSAASTLLCCFTPSLIIRSFHLQQPLAPSLAASLEALISFLSNFLPPSAANCLDFSASPSLLCIPFSSFPPSPLPPFLFFPLSPLPPSSPFPPFHFFPPFTSFPLHFFPPSLLSPFSAASPLSDP
ncbi:unnamed protein product [Closterium sp. Yama58-4]|nr:unnamed protein product [Closterium sp. Yama58-4]